MIRRYMINCVLRDIIIAIFIHCQEGNGYNQIVNDVEFNFNELYEDPPQNLAIAEQNPVVPDLEYEQGLGRPIDGNIVNFMQDIVANERDLDASDFDVESLEDESSESDDTDSNENDDEQDIFENDFDFFNLVEDDVINFQV